MDLVKQDVELKCNVCGSETLATIGCYALICSHCQMGKRKIIKEHGRILSFAEVKKFGFTIG